MSKEKKLIVALKENMVLSVGIIIILVIDLCIIAKTKGMTTPADEIGMFAVPAKLAGYDWANVVSESGYYGFGYFSLFSPFFRYMNNPELLHQVILFFNTIVKVAIIPIAYSIEIKFLGAKNKIMAALLAILLSVANVSLRASRPYNEFPMHLLLWIDMYLLCQLIDKYDNKKKKKLYSYLIIVCLIYGLLLHKRMETIVYAIVVTLSVLMLIKKKCYIHFTAVIIGVIGWVITNKFIVDIQNWIWGGSGTELGNTAVTISSKISFTNIKMYILWMDIIIGNIMTMIMQTGGLFAFSIISFLLMIISWIKGKRIKDEELPMFSMMICMVLCIGATLLALLVSSWYSGMTTTFFQGEPGQVVYEYKGMVYLRYWGLYVTPFIMCGILWIHNKKILNKAISITIGLVILVTSLFIKMVLPWIENNADCLIFIQALAGWKKDEICSRESFLLAFIVFFIVFFILIQCIRRKKINVGICIICVYFIWQQLWSSIYYDIPVTNEIYEIVDASVERLKNTEKDFLPKRIISIELNERLSLSYKQSLSLQFYLKNYTIYTEIPNNLQEGDLIITREEVPEELMIDKLKGKSYKMEKIDKDEVWYLIY